MNQKDYLIIASDNQEYNIRLCEIISTGSESESYDKLYIIYKTPAGEYLKRVKHFHPLDGAPDITYEVITQKEVKICQEKKFS